MNIVSIDGNTLKPLDVLDIASGKKKAVFSDDARMQVMLARETVTSIIDRGEVAYGINTGFGALSNVTISPEELSLLQENLIRSHACGLGDDMEPADVLAMMVIRANSLAKGHSGVRPLVIDLLLNCVHSRITPRIPRIGSLGASGDLAPLAHLALGLIGEGDAYIEGSSAGGGSNHSGWRRVSMSAALKQAGLEPLKLEAKEGLSLINGTTQMCAWLSRCHRELSNLVYASDVALSMSIEGLNASHAPFDSRLHQARPHYGQIKMAQRVLQLLSGGDINSAHADCGKVQDAYSLRCSPQVHGPAHEALDDLENMLITELNSATDNPLIFPDPDNRGPHEVVSGGNFHGQVLALMADRLAIICHELGVISERRINQLLDPQWSELPAFLAKKSGLESGFMIVQYVAAASISEMHVLSSPATLSNISVSNSKEDHVSMGATAVFKLVQQMKHLARVLSCEMICATQALDYNKNEPGENIQIARKLVRKFVDELDGDRVMSGDIEMLATHLIKSNISEELGVL